MHEQLLEELDETRNRLITVFVGFKKEQINTIPFAGSWTAAQLAEHIRKSLKGVLNTIHGPVKETTRAPNAKVDILKQTFLDFNTRFTAPDFLTPSNLPLEQDVLLNSLEIKMKEIADAVQTLNLNETCIGYALPYAGSLTRLEWIYFVIYHTQRHTQQLKNIYHRVAMA